MDGFLVKTFFLVMSHMALPQFMHRDLSISFSFCKDINPIVSGSFMNHKTSSKLNHLPKAPCVDTITVESGLPQVNGEQLLIPSS
jgi:hypothetical protein